MLMQCMFVTYEKFIMASLKIPHFFGQWVCMLLLSVLFLTSKTSLEVSKIFRMENLIAMLKLPRCSWKMVSMGKMEVTGTMEKTGASHASRWTRLPGPVAVFSVYEHDIRRFRKLVLLLAFPRCLPAGRRSSELVI